MNKGTPGSVSPRLAIGAPIWFFALIAGAWSWFHVGRPNTGAARIEVSAHENIPGWNRRDQTLRDNERAILGTTNLVQAVFVTTNQARIIAFFADWQASQGAGLNVVQHTPDMCWVDAGASIAAVDCPARMDLVWDSVKVPFECRVFQLPGAERLEVAVWCTLVGGRILAERPPAALELDAGEDHEKRAVSAHRRRAWEQFRKMVSDRTPGTGGKQFIRFSTEMTTDTAEALGRLKRFGQSWLEARSIAVVAQP